MANTKISALTPGTPAQNTDQIPAARAGANVSLTVADIAAGEAARATAAEALLVPKTTQVNGHALSGNVVVSASDLTTGTLPHAQLPALVSGDIPNNSANTSGTAAGLSSPIAESSVTNLVADLAAKDTALAGEAAARAAADALVANLTLVQSGLMAEYRMTAGAGTSLADSSGNANHGTFAAAGPTWIAGKGLSFARTSLTQVDLPAALNSAKTIQLFIGWQPQNETGSSPRYASPLIGSDGTLANNNGIIMNASADPTAGVGGRPFSTVDGPSSGLRSTARGAAAGNFLLTYVKNTTLERLYVNGQECSYAGQGSLNSGQLAGHYILGGGSAAQGFVTIATYFTGQMYYAVFYNRELTDAEIAQNSAYMAATVGARGVALFTDNTGTQDQVVIDGDSLSTNVGGSYPNFLSINGSPAISQGCAKAGSTIGPPAGTAVLGTSANTAVDPYFQENAVKNCVVIWIGTNDIRNSLAAALVHGEIAAYCRGRKAKGFKVAVVSLLSENGFEAGNFAVNALIKSNWRTYADAYVNLAEIPILGAAGAYKNTLYFLADGIHQTAMSSQRLVAPLVSRIVNRLYGNLDYPNATTYAATAGAVDADVCVILNTASGGQVFTLQSALGLTGQEVSIKNIGSASWSLVPKPIVSGVISATSLASTTLTVTVANNFAAGDHVVFTKLNTNTTKNGFMGQILAATPTQFTMTVTAASWSGSDTAGVVTQVPYCELGAITNISETAGNVVSLTVKTNRQVGEVITPTGLTVGTWLNSQAVTLLSNNGTVITFNDPATHGAQGSAAETGYTMFTYPVDTIDGATSVTLAAGDGGVFQAKSTGWIRRA